MSCIEKAAAGISRKSRAKKFAQFMEEVRPAPEETIIDVGVNFEEYSEVDNYLEKKYPHPENITAVGLGDPTLFTERYPRIRVQEADGCQLPFAENAYDISYSNAVIEHVGPKNRQLLFLRELCRVSRRGFLTTPNRLFPIEVHTRLPLLHLLLSKKQFDACATRLGKGWATGDYMHLLSERELRTLLTKAGIEEYKLVKNRFFGWPMTFTVLWKK